MKLLYFYETSQLICLSENSFPAYHEEECIEELVQTQIIENWESQDEPQHLRTIRNNILQSPENQTGRLLGLYQQILQKREIIADDSPEQTQLRLTGLIVKQQGKLRVYNQIYAEIFNQAWLEKEFANIRPYAESLNAWVASNFQDELCLLRGKNLQNARLWAADKGLSDLYRKFLDASQELEKRDVQKRLQAEAEASKILAEANEVLVAANKKAKQRIKMGGIILAITLVAAIVAGISTNTLLKDMQLEKIKSLTISSHALLNSNREVDALVTALKAAIKLQSAKLWNLDGNEIKTLGKHDNYVISVSFSPDGKTIASTSADKTVKLWSLNGQLIKTLRGHNNGVSSVSFSPDGKTIASASADNTVKLWNISNLEPTTFIGHDDSLWAVNFSPDAKIIASAGDDKTIKLWNLDGQELASIKADSDSVWNRIWSLNFSPNGQIIATANYDKTIRLFDLNGHNIKTWKGHNQEVTDINFSPDGQTLVSASYDGTVKLWNINGQELRTLEANAGKVFSANFSPNGQTIVSAHNDGTIKLWNLQGQNFKTFKAHNSYVTNVRFSPDGQIIASVSQDKTIKIWNLDGKELKTFKAHNTGITKLSFSPDGKILTSAGADGTIKLWRVTDGLELKTIEGRGYAIWNLSFSPDGKKIVSVSDDGLVELWNAETLDFEQLIVRGCNWVDDYLKNNHSLNEKDKHICQ